MEGNPSKTVTSNTQMGSGDLSHKIQPLALSRTIGRGVFRGARGHVVPRSFRMEGISFAALSFDTCRKCRTRPNF